MLQDRLEACRSAAANSGTRNTFSTPSHNYSVRDELITPAYAKQLLATVQGVVLNPHKARAYEKLLKNGQWVDGEGRLQPTHTTYGGRVTLDRDGRMIKGRHLCMAVVASNISVRVRVYRRQGMLQPKRPPLRRAPTVSRAELVRRGVLPGPESS